MLWYSLFSYFWLETTVRENNWMRTTSVPVKVIFFRKFHSESTWSQLCSKFFLNNYEAPWQWHLKDTLQLKILRTWINISVVLARRVLTYHLCFSFSQTSLPFCHNLFSFLPFDILRIVKFMQYIYAFFKITVKFWWGLMLFFEKVYNYKMLLFFYFPWNISTC